MLLVPMHLLSLTIRKLVGINLMHLNSQHMSSAAIYLPILFQYYILGMERLLMTRLKRWEFHIENLGRLLAPYTLLFRR